MPIKILRKPEIPAPCLIGRPNSMEAVSLEETSLKGKGIGRSRNWCFFKGLMCYNIPA